MADPCIDLSNADADVSFSKPTLNANPCNFSFTLPSFTVTLVLPTIPFPPPLPFPIPSFEFKLSCSLDQPISVSAGLTWGGGKIPCFEPSPDEEQ